MSTHAGHRQRLRNRYFLADSSRLEDFWRMRLGALTNEVFEVAYLDASGHIMRDGVERLSEGTTHRAPAYPRRIVEQALKRGAASIVLAHNHTNGDPSPSPQHQARQWGHRLLPPGLGRRATNERRRSPLAHRDQRPRLERHCNQGLGHGELMRPNLGGHWHGLTLSSRQSTGVGASGGRPAGGLGGAVGAGLPRR